MPEIPPTVKAICKFAFDVTIWLGALVCVLTYLGIKPWWLPTVQVPVTTSTPASASFSSHGPVGWLIFGLILFAIGLASSGYSLYRNLMNARLPKLANRSVYDAVSDCSMGYDPPGPWKYGYSDGVGNDFNPFEARQSNAFPGVDRWFCTERYAALGVMHNRTNHTVAGEPATYTIPTNMMHMHPGIDGYCAVIRWQCPEDGIYTIEGSFEGLDKQLGADPEVHIMKNLADSWHTTLGGVPSVKTFSLTESFESGDNLDFVVSQGVNWGADSVGLKATVKKV